MALKNIYIAGAILFVLVVVGLGNWWSKQPNVSVSGNVMKTVTIGSARIDAEVVDTPSSRQQGLSGRESLPAGRGMLFIFDEPGSWGIWMKDMRFSIDILWAREDGTISTIARNVSPDTYPTVFSPKTPDALYVLELPAGAAANIAEGLKLVVE